MHAAQHRFSKASPRCFRRALLDWYRVQHRALPWRETRDPYAIWVSEIMLQQTQIATVIPYYNRFLRAFPNVERLARTRLERVLQLWSGLGYYRRARHLHEAAKKVLAEFGGEFPATLREARSLPGVGSYTAAAVLSIAYNVALAALDGNVARIIARLDALSGSMAEPAFRTAVESTLDGLLSRLHPGDFNQALMELGQTICLPRSPRCSLCPVRRWCRAHQLGCPEAYPSPRPRRSTERHHLAAAVIFRRMDLKGDKPNVPGAPTEVMLVRGLDDGLMTDLWNFPSAFGHSPTDARAQLQLKLAHLNLDGQLAAESGSGVVLLGGELARLRHGVTYRNIDVRAYRVDVGAQSPGVRWLRLSSFRRAAVSELARKIARALDPICPD
jgi:A/G-specific adenine glycosylase